MTEEELVERFEQENITLASVPSRAIAYLIDEVLISVLFMVIYWEQFESSASLEQTIILMNTMFFYIMTLKVLYQAFFVWFYGATPGKMAMKIRVMYVYDMDNPSLAYAAIRSLIRVFSESIFYLGFVWALMNPKRESWHDKAARTLVVNV